MIKVLMTGICEGCKYADLKLECYQTYDDKKYWSIICSHASACDSAENRTIDRLSKEWVKDNIAKKGQTE